MFHLLAAASHSQSQSLRVKTEQPTSQLAIWTCSPWPLLQREMDLTVHAFFIGCVFKFFFFLHYFPSFRYCCCCVRIKCHFTFRDKSANLTGKLFISPHCIAPWRLCSCLLHLIPPPSTAQLCFSTAPALSAVYFVCNIIVFEIFFFYYLLSSDPLLPALTLALLFFSK